MDLRRERGAFNWPRMNYQRIGVDRGREQQQQKDRKGGGPIAHQGAGESRQEASRRLKPALQGPPVDYSGKDKLPGASIHSQLPPLGLETPKES